MEGNIWQAEAMVEVKGVKLSRRTTRDLESGVCLEDLWISDTTAPRIPRRAFKKPRDIQVTIEIAEDKLGVPFEEQEMTREEASKFRAVAARLNFLAQDKPDLQYCSKECSRIMANPFCTRQ